MMTKLGVDSNWWDASFAHFPNERWDLSVQKRWEMCVSVDVSYTSHELQLKQRSFVSSRLIPVLGKVRARARNKLEPFLCSLSSLLREKEKYIQTSYLLSLNSKWDADAECGVVEENRGICEEKFWIQFWMNFDSSSEEESQFHLLVEFEKNLNVRLEDSSLSSFRAITFERITVSFGSHSSERWKNFQTKGSIDVWVNILLPFLESESRRRKERKKWGFIPEILSFFLLVLFCRFSVLRLTSSEVLISRMASFCAMTPDGSERRKRFWSEVTVGGERTFLELSPSMATDEGSREWMSGGLFIASGPTFVTNNDPIVKDHESKSVLKGILTRKREKVLKEWHSESVQLVVSVEKQTRNLQKIEQFYQNLICPPVHDIENVDKNNGHTKKWK